MSQPKSEIEKAYETPDPWGYKTSAQDHVRKQTLLGVIEIFMGTMFERAIDVCCGEGWITEDLPAVTIHGIEISDNAAARFSSYVKRVDGPIGKYGLVLATGCLYNHYDLFSIIDHIREASGPGTLIVTSNIETWEKPEAITLLSRIGRQVFEARFPYNEHHQKLRVFQC